MLELLTTTWLLPSWVFLVVAFLFGTILGSFLDVCICRFHTGQSIGGHSHCLSCGKRLRWYELLPVVSYLVQVGRCRACGSHIPARLLLMELVTGSLFVLALIFAASLIELVWLLLVLLTLLFITVYDYRHFIIPDEGTLTLLGLMAVWLGYQYWIGELPLIELGYTVGASLAGAAFFLALWLISRGQWLGFGDVKLAVPLGLWVGYSQVFSFIVLSFWVGALISIGIVGCQRLQRGQPQLHLAPETLTMKSVVPFAPFLILGATLVYFLKLNVLTFFSFA